MTADQDFPDIRPVGKGGRPAPPQPAGHPIGWAAASSNGPQDEARAARLGLVTTNPGDADAPTYVLTRDDGRLALAWTGPHAPRPVAADFVSGATGHRLQQAGGDRALARALGWHRGARTVVDATAGLGRDAFVLAKAGFTVLAIEREPLLAELLADGLRRAAREPRLHALLGGRLALLGADARAVLTVGRHPPDAVYLDPMFPTRQKSALVKKEMRLFADLVGRDDDATALFEAARACARMRVVVKRPRHAPELAGPPDHAVRGARVRWDVYLT